MANILKKAGFFMSKLPLNKKHWIVKKNELNEFRPQDLKLQELRLFSIYLSKINPRDLSTRVVRFSIADFRAIMEFGRVDIKKLKDVADSLLTKVTGVPTETGGLIRFQVFKECRIDKDENNQWYIEIDAHDRSLPLMFDLKNHYFKYELWNALRLKSKNQLRMYEILKQYEKIGYRIISVIELREMLGVEKNEHQRFNNFKLKILDACQKALTENTDISYIYEPYGKKGQGGKVLELKFTIIKNKDFVDPLSLNQFIDLRSQGQSEEKDVIEVVEDNFYTPTYRLRLERMALVCENSFRGQEIEQLDVAIKTYHSEIYNDINKSADRLSFFYKQMVASYENGVIKTNKHKYLLGIIKNSERSSGQSEKTSKNSKKLKDRRGMKNFSEREEGYYSEAIGKTYIKSVNSP